MKFFLVELQPRRRQVLARQDQRPRRGVVGPGDVVVVRTQPADRLHPVDHAAHDPGAVDRLHQIGGHVDAVVTPAAPIAGLARRQDEAADWKVADAAMEEYAPHSSRPLGGARVHPGWPPNSIATTTTAARKAR